MYFNCKLETENLILSSTLFVPTLKERVGKENLFSHKYKTSKVHNPNQSDSVIRQHQSDLRSQKKNVDMTSHNNSPFMEVKTDRAVCVNTPMGAVSVVTKS